MDSNTVISRLIEISRHCSTIGEHLEKSLNLDPNIPDEELDIHILLEDTLEMLYDMDTKAEVIDQYSNLKKSVKDYPIKRTWSINKEKLEGDFNVYGSRFLKLCERL